MMDLANRVMAAATPGLRVPTSVRVGDAAPRIVRVDDLFGGTVDALRSMIDELPGGGLAVVVPDELSDRVSTALTEAGIDHGRAATAGLDESVTVVPVSVVKGLELDGVVVVEPSRIVDDELHGLRALYVALTRSTQRLTVVHCEELPEPLRAAEFS
jgi:hypothetical protein